MRGARLWFALVLAACGGGDATPDAPPGEVPADMGPDGDPLKRGWATQLAEVNRRGLARARGVVHAGGDARHDGIVGGAGRGEG